MVISCLINTIGAVRPSAVIVRAVIIQNSNALILSTKKYIYIFGYWTIDIAFPERDLIHRDRVTPLMKRALYHQATTAGIVVQKKVNVRIINIIFMTTSKTSASVSKICSTPYITKQLFCFNTNWKFWDQ